MAQKKKKEVSIIQRHWPFVQSLLYVVISLLIAFLLFQTGAFHTLLASLHDLGYIGAFLAGMFFVSIFTAAPAAVVLLTLSESISLVPLVIFAGFGSVIGDMIILSFLSNTINSGFQFAPKEKRIQKLIKSLRHTKYRFMLTLIGALVVASPLPDELGLALMGISKIKPVYTLVLTFFLNTLGIAVLLLVFR